MTVETIFNWNFHFIATTTVQPFLTRYLRKECSDLNEVASDNEDDKDDDDDDDVDNEDNSKDAEVVAFRTGEALTMLDRSVKLKYQSKEERNSLIAMKDKLEKIRVMSKNQSHINDYFILE